ncbi:MAG: hypothetical protein HETSPECPRED_001843 [Heterodermia speciosa]|uniref:Uncharacterized protein n=1 Tax=Heterodermia speciosa TaxID=116794 RepID=A0A8H3PFD9_9LECA|nr:MAG: hypothetical protein HETSPECPRED_001843 [Heterodermia speciosa]
MPILQRRPAMLSSRESTSPPNSAESDCTLKEHIVLVGDDYEKPHKDMDFPSAKLGSMSYSGKSKNNLRIKTYSKTELHDRYLSSEEEPSPSPDGHENHDEELRHKESAKFNDDVGELYRAIEGKPEIAIAVPILSLGRPKLVDITNLAPIHKRKQRIPKSQLPHIPFKIPEKHLSAVVDEYVPFAAHEAAKIAAARVSFEPVQTPNRRKSRHILTAPDSWLPNDETLAVDEEHCIPDLEVRQTPSYHDYDPYSLEPPRLVSSAMLSRHRGSPGIIQAHADTSGWKGLTRSLSLAKRQKSHQQITKKPRMVARGANERDDMLAIPPFWFESRATA